MNHQKAKFIRRLRRRNHVRSHVKGTPERPRLSVYRSSRHIYAQLIDDLAGVTLAAASSETPDLRDVLPKTTCKDRKTKQSTKVAYGGNVKAATIVGKKLAEVAKEKGITKAAFDRGHYRYHGRVKALADGAREGGLQF